jgi:hypothetical protein
MERSMSGVRGDDDPDWKVICQTRHDVVWRGRQSDVTVQRV